MPCRALCRFVDLDLSALTDQKENMKITQRKTVMRSQIRFRWCSNDQGSRGKRSSERNESCWSLVFASPFVPLAA